MEHIVQFAVGIDDNAIVKNIMEHAEKVITDELTQQVRDKLFSSSYYARHATEKDPLSSYAEGLINRYLDSHKDEIIEKAAIHLADKLSRTKAVKERIVQEVLKE